MLPFSKATVHRKDQLTRFEEIFNATTLPDPSLLGRSGLVVEDRRKRKNGRCLTAILYGRSVETWNLC
jgi:hypothetical protein